MSIENNTNLETNENLENITKQNNYCTNKINEYMINLEKYAIRIGINADTIENIKSFLTNDLNKDNEWCLFHQPPSYWINHYLVCLNIECKIPNEFHNATWDDIDKLKISNNAKEKIRSIGDCPKCRIYLCSGIQSLQVSKYFPRRAIESYFNNNELYMYSGNKWVEEIGICKHYLVDE
jgi:hypothetical protein